MAGVIPPEVVLRAVLDDAITTRGKRTRPVGPPCVIMNAAATKETIDSSVPFNIEPAPSVEFSEM